MPTQVEKTLSHKRKRKGVLVPMLEDLFQSALEFQEISDANFIYSLVMKQMERERRRSLKGMYGPSSLASCLRQVYFSRHSKRLGIPRLKELRIEPNFYFATGDWLHMKWQYALHKLNKVTDDEEFQLWGLEVPVTSKHGDHGGTIDALARIHGVWTVVDFKGWNVRDFRRASGGEVSFQAAFQVADYGLLANVDKTLQLGGRVERGLLVVENKGGPDRDHPIALTEVEIQMSDYLPQIKTRMSELRRHEKEDSIPEPECEKTTSFQFASCPFHRYCRAEVKEIEKQNKEDTSVSVRPSSRSRAHRRKRL